MTLKSWPFFGCLRNLWYFSQYRCTSSKSWSYFKVDNCSLPAQNFHLPHLIPSNGKTSLQSVQDPNTLQQQLTDSSQGLALQSFVQANNWARIWGSLEWLVVFKYKALLHCAQLHNYALEKAKDKTPTHFKKGAGSCPGPQTTHWFYKITGRV